MLGAEVAAFLMHSTMKLSSRRGIFLVGEIESGTIRAGMFARIRVDGGVYMEVPIVGVEFVDGPGRASKVALQIAPDDPKDEELIAAFCGDGDTITIVAPNDGSHRMMSS